MRPPPRRREERERDRRPERLLPTFAYVAKSDVFVRRERREIFSQRLAKTRDGALARVRFYEHFLFRRVWGVARTSDDDSVREQ